MKIAYISSAFLADCDVPLIKEMQKKNADVYYFLQMSDTSKQATIIDIHRLKSSGGVFPASEYAELAFLSKEIQLDHVFVVNFPRPKDLHWQSLRAVSLLFRKLLSEKFDVIHITSPLRYGSFLLYLLRSRMVLTMHDPLPHSSDMNWLNRMHRWMAFHCLSHFIILSKSLKDEFIKNYHLEKKNVYLSKLSIYTHLQQTVGKSLELPSNYILFVGSINPHKGIRYICEALTKIEENVLLVIAGRGDFDFDIQPYLKTGRIILINRFVTNEELYTLISNSLFVCCPYIDATQSGVVLSAFALAKPVLATNVGALTEEIRDRRHGILVNPRDSDALATGIRQMLVPGVLEKMSEAIKDDFSQGRESWSYIADNTLRIYNEISK